MIGTWTWAPNRAALSWMLEQVLPRLPAHCELVLAGSGLKGFVLPPRTRALGRIVNPSQLYDQVDLVAVPSIKGSGAQEKAVEALACGLPVVATRHALRGLEFEMPPHILVADGLEDFVRLCAEGSLSMADDAAAALDAWAQVYRNRYARAVTACLAATRDPTRGRQSNRPARDT